MYIWIDNGKYITAINKKSMSMDAENDSPK